MRPVRESVRVAAMTRPTLLPAAFVAAFGLTFALYWPGLAGPFLLDDFNTFIAKLPGDGSSFGVLLERVLADRSGPLGRPLAMISFAANAWLAGGLDAYPIKLTNLLLHLLTGLGLYRFTWVLLRPGSPLGLDERRAAWAALLATAVWLLHPLHVSTVLYAVQRMAILAALFVVWGGKRADTR